MLKRTSLTLAAILAASSVSASPVNLPAMVNHTLKVWDGGSTQEFCYLYANTYRVAAFQILDRQIAPQQLRELRWQLPKTTPGRKIDGLLRAATVRDGRMSYTEHEIMIEQMHRMVSQDCLEKGGFR